MADWTKDVTIKSGSSDSRDCHVCSGRYDSSLCSFHVEVYDEEGGFLLCAYHLYHFVSEWQDDWSGDAKSLLRKLCQEWKEQRAKWSSKDQDE